MKIYNDVNKLDDLGLSAYGFVQFIGLSRDVDIMDGVSKYDVEIILVHYQETKQLVLKFFEVIDFKMNSLDGMLGIRLGIVDVSDRQLEGAFYSVSDEEYGSFSFLCREFSVEIFNREEKESDGSKLRYHVRESGPISGEYKPKIGKNKD